MVIDQPENEGYKREGVNWSERQLTFQTWIKGTRDKADVARTTTARERRRKSENERQTILPSLVDWKQWDLSM